MVARVARIRGNLLQVVTDELPENLSCVAYRARITQISTQDKAGFPRSPYAGNRLYRNIPSRLGFDSWSALRTSKRRAGLDLQ